jgi:hypothetical protein
MHLARSDNSLDMFVAPDKLAAKGIKLELSGSWRVF